jgi:hypothetical protein
VLSHAVSSSLKWAFALRANRFLPPSKTIPRIIFCVFGPEITCQAPTNPNSFPNINIRVAFSYTQTAILKIEQKKGRRINRNPRNPRVLNILPVTPLFG